MPKANLKLDSIDDNVAEYFLHMLQNFRKRKLTPDEVRDMSSGTGVTVNFSGGSPGQFREELYVIYFKNFSKTATPQLALNVVVVSGSTRHDDLLDRGDVVVAGSILDGRYQMLSSSWATKTRNSNPDGYGFGEVVNELFREAFGV